MAAYTILLEATGAGTLTPLFDFPSGTIEVEIDDVSDGFLTTGVSGSIAVTTGQKVEYICSDWDVITKIDIHGDPVSGDISGWSLPSSLVTLRIYSTLVSGDISGWTLPSSIADFRIYSTLLSGDISGWTLPNSLVTFYISSTAVSGDISGWTLPNSLVTFNINSTAVSGDISGWTLPNSLVNFRIYFTSFSGDISGWTLPISLETFRIDTTSVDYDSATGAFEDVTDSLIKIDFDNCALTQSQVDNALADLVTSGITDSSSAKTLDIAGTNAAPGATGAGNKYLLELRGWTVNANTSAFAYDKATNTTVAITGTEGSPITFNDMYLADQAGLVELLAAEAGVANNTLTYQITPANKNGLKTDFVVAAKTAEADFIFITGIDINGDAQTESLDVTAGNGTYTTTKWFATITNIDCSDNAAGGGAVWADGTVQVIQNQWGVVQQCVVDAQYTIDCNIEFGDGSTATYFTSSRESIYFADGVAFSITSNATLQLGLLVGSWGVWGSYWSFNTITAAIIIESSASTATFKCYASMFQSRSSDRVQWLAGTVIFNKSILSHDSATFGLNTQFEIWATVTSLTIEDTYFNTLKGLVLKVVPDTFTNVHTHNTVMGVVAESSNPITATGIRFTDDSAAEVRNVSVGVFTVLNPVSFIDSLWIDHVNGSIIEQYTTNIHTTDKDGADLENVTVAASYTHLVEGDDGKTYKCIQNHTSVDATHKPITGSDWASFWELFDAAGGLGGDWITTFDYKVDEAEWSDTSDVNGNIAEQVIQYKKWTTPSELLEARIHKFTYTHAAYPDFTMSDIIVDHPLVWEFDMGQSTSNLVTINETAIDNKISLTGGKVDGVALVDVTTENTDMVGTAGANTVVPDVAGTAATLHGITDGKIDAAQTDLDTITDTGVNIVSEDNIDFGAAKKTSLNAATPAVTVSDKTGFSLSTAGILAIWHQLKAAVVTANTMGKLVVDFLNAAVGSRATAAKQDTMETTLNTVAGDVANIDGAAMRGTDGANTTVPDAASTAATLHGITDGKIDAAAIQIDQLRTWAVGNWQPKDGVPGTYEVLDPDDGVTPVLEVTPDGTTGILQVVIL